MITVSDDKPYRRYQQCRPHSLLIQSYHSNRKPYASVDLPPDYDARKWVLAVIRINRLRNVRNWWKVAVPIHKL